LKQVIIRRGRTAIEEVPAPGVEPGCVLVRVAYSCLSPGTELSGIARTGTPAWKKALDEPAKVANIARMALAEGVEVTRKRVKRKLEIARPTGYSAAGTVLAVGEGVSDLRPGDRVACAGTQCAYHAEIINVPRNLAVLVPEGVGEREASTVALGAIALQGVRRLAPTLGECFAVVGLGLLGQLTVQLLKANGCTVVGVELDRERLALAESLGLDVAVHPEDGAPVERIVKLTGGHGIDGVVVTAASASERLLSEAFQMCRVRGRVVLVGDVPMVFDRADIFAKELDFFISSSYGPGRYQGAYEEGGLDYPIGQVRWTENRNMDAYLRLIASGAVRLGDPRAPILGPDVPLEDAPSAYERLSGADKPLVVQLVMGTRGEAPTTRTLRNPRLGPERTGPIGLAVVGAGSFAKAVHLENLEALRERFHLRAIVGRSGHNAMLAALGFEAEVATTDFDAVLADDAVHAVLIATRHDLHGEQTLRALQAGKHVLVEKPLALTAAELDAIEAFYAERGEGEASGRAAPLLLTGFNRRFSPSARAIAALTARRAHPMVIDYRMNAGYIPGDHWVHGPEGGGRNLGEACHLYDLFTYFTGARVTRVQAQPIGGGDPTFGARDNFVATMGFADGSVATLTYTALGSAAHPKEAMELYVDGTVAVLDDYLRVTFAGAPRPGIEHRKADKGHKGQLVAFADAIARGGSDWPNPLWQQLQASRIALEVEAWLVGERAQPDAT
jgi:predicted dehydrogenase/threonine dehydrogenase-like Zn-dependent dehydrogenase